MKDPKKLKELVLDSIDLAEVMLQYGVWFVFDPRRGSQVQYRCPFHGKDNKPSGRYYRAPDAVDGRRAHCYCWFCQKSWDVVAFIMERESFSFLQALQYIVGRYNIDTSVIADEPEMKFEKLSEVSETSAIVIMRQAESAVQELRGKADFEKYRILCSALLGAKYDVSRGTDVTELAKKIHSKALKLQGEFNG